MNAGQMNDDLQPVITVMVAGPDGDRRSLDAILDTRFDGDLALSREAIQQLRLKVNGIRQVQLSTGEVVELPSFSGTLAYGDHQREITILQHQGDDNFLGMMLLLDSRLTLEVWVGGRVGIELLEGVG